MRTTQVFFLIVGLLLLASSGYSQKSETDSSRLRSMSLEELMQVKVTGSTLTAEELKTVPAAVTVFTHEEIKRMGLETLDELMNLVPGFQSYRSSLSPLDVPFSSRGRRIGVEAAEVLVLVDGQRLADPASGSSTLFVPKFPLVHIERVEFIRGPGAAVYGSNAMMGVINIVTRSDVNEVSVSYGSFNRRQAYLLISQRIGDVAIDLFGHLEADDGDDYRVQDTFSPSRIDTDDPRKFADLNAKIRWHNTQVNFQHNQFKSENFYELDGLSNGFNQHSAQISSISLKQNFGWQSFSSYVWLNYSRTKLNSNAQLTPPGALAAISSPASNDALFASFDFDDPSEARLQWHNDWNINAQSGLQFGLELRHINVPEVIAKSNFDLGDLSNGNFPIRYYGALRANTTVQAESSRDIVGLYGQYQRQLFETTHLTLGLRYDDFSGIGSQFSPRLGLVHELNDHHSVKLLYGAAFRAPAESELNLLNNPVLLGNPDLKAETVQSWDLIWVGQWPHTGISIGYFENHFDDSIVQTSTGSGTQQSENVDQDPTKGFEFELSHELNEHWLLRGTYTYISEKPDLSFRETDQLASLMVNYQQGNWNANLTATYHNERDMPAVDSNNNRIALDDYWQLFGKLSYNFTSDWQAFVQVKNLLDEDYLTPPVTAALSEGVPNRGREILAGIKWRFLR